MTEQVRVAKLEHDGSWFVVEAKDIPDILAAIDGQDDVVYTLTFTNMDKAVFDSLPEFQGF